MTRRGYTAATNANRCKAVVTLKDGSTADCMRPRVNDHFCWQHAEKIGDECFCCDEGVAVKGPCAFCVATLRG